MIQEYVFRIAGILFAAIATLLLLFFVWMLASNDSPQRSEEIQFSLAQSVSAQTAPAEQMPTCEQILSEFEADPETQQASPAERQFVLAFLQAFAQGLLDEGAPEASRLDPDGNGIACDEFLSAGGQSATAGSTQPPLSGGGHSRAGTVTSSRLAGPLPAPPRSCPTVVAHKNSLQCGTGAATELVKRSPPWNHSTGNSRGQLGSLAS